MLQTNEMIVSNIIDMIRSHEPEGSSINIVSNLQNYREAIQLTLSDGFCVPLFSWNERLGEFFFTRFKPFHLFYNNVDLTDSIERQIANIQWFKNFYQAQSAVLGQQIMDMFKQSVTNFILKTDFHGGIEIFQQPSASTLLVTGERWDSVSLSTTWTTDFKLKHIAFFEKKYNSILDKMSPRQQIKCVYLLLNYYTDDRIHSELKSVVDVENNLNSRSFDEVYDIFNMIRI